MTELVKDRNRILSARMARLIDVAGLIPRDLLVKERSIYASKWIDYAYIDPVEATKQFETSYVAAFKYYTRIHIDHRIEHRRGLFGNNRYFRLGSGAKDRQALIGLWKLRQLADELGIMPYDHFCMHALGRWIEAGPQRLPQPNQLYGSRWTLTIQQAVVEAFIERNKTAPIYPTTPQASRYHNTLAEENKIQRCIEIIELGQRHPYRIADAVRGRGLISEDRARAAFGDDAYSRSLEEVVVDNSPDTSHLTKSDYIPACAFVPHAYDDTALECVKCHFRATCRMTQTIQLKKMMTQHGSIDPVRDRNRAQNAERQRRFRERERLKLDSCAYSSTTEQPAAAETKL